MMELPVYHRPHFKSLLIQTWQRLKMFISRAGRVIILVSMLIGVLSNFSFNGNTVHNINESALAVTSKTLTPLLQPVGVKEDNWQATVGLLTGIMAKEVVIGTLNTLYTGEDIQDSRFAPSDFNLLSELTGTLTLTWDSLKASLSPKALSNPIGASKGDGEMTAGQMRVMSTKFGSVSAAYSYLIFVLLYVPCVSVMGAIAREVGRYWMLFSFFWGINAAFSTATLFNQLVTFAEHPNYSSLCLFSVVVANFIIILLLRQWGCRIREHRFSVTLRTHGSDCGRCKGCGHH